MATRGYGEGTGREPTTPKGEAHADSRFDIRLSAEDRPVGGTRPARKTARPVHKEPPALDRFDRVPPLNPPPDGRDTPRAARAAAAPERGAPAPEVPVPDAAGRGARGDAELSGRAHKRSRAKAEKPARARPVRRRRSLLWGLVKWGMVLAVWGVIAVAGVIAYEASKLPPMQTLMIPKRPPTVTIQGADGKTLATRGDMGGVAVPIGELPPYLPKAFVAIEDQRFYSHFGLDPEGLARALVTNLTSRRLRQGGSTLTQQLAKNLFLTQERTASRKIQELVLALWLEQKFSKNEILDLYLNRVYFGAGAYGVEAAAQRYFGKSARQVTLAEAAMLAGLVNSPSRLAPTRNLKGAQARAALVLHAMKQQGLITPQMAETALARPAQLAPPKAPDSMGYVADWVMDQLDSFVGLLSGDVTVRTTIDGTLQQTAEKALDETLAKSGTKYGVEQGAMVSLDTDGAVKALLGGRSYEKSQYNRAVTAKRQPGSAFKPFIYLTALESGLTPDTIREDAPIQLKGWRPENASHDYRGPVSLTTALALSLNTVSVRLALEVGPKAVVATAHRLGIVSNLDPNPSIALGTSEVSVLELAGAYVPFANGGIGVIPYVIETVKDAQGQVLYQRAGSGPGRVMDPAYAAEMNQMLTQTLIMGTARRADLPGWEAAGKTGTSQDYRDAWFVGYTARFVTVVWLGNDDSSPTKRASGANLPVEIWSRYMKVAHKGLPVAELPGGTRTAGFGGVGYGEPGGSYLPPENLPDDRPPAVVGQIGGGPAPQREPPMTIDRWFAETFLGQGRR
ncbi:MULTISPECIES: transglycosylase domain-containing protein [unclassified Xanthobacter]|uniref:transglycosylase domain-containing protein n=1 Tax=unclassified Xanthobacter TaxID=2623496 RepID=UPI001EE10C15|nr:MULTISPECIES: penicillin-binding protein 1A [unclassified Xanthobacter]